MQLLLSYLVGLLMLISLFSINISAFDIAWYSSLVFTNYLEWGYHSFGFGSENILGLRECVTVLEIVFVGQREVFVCLDFVHFFFSLAAKLIGQFF